MTYDFDTIISRRGSGSYKWDTPSAADVLPMWVADMDFRVAPEILEALQKRLDHGIFGYTCVPQEYYDAAISWLERRHGWHTQREWFIYTSGVVPALAAIVRALTQPGDKVIIQSPAYNCFFSCVRNNGCEVLENPLHYEGGLYTLDLEDLERKAADPAAKLLLLCNPHNPSGRVWSPDELRAISHICEANDVTVVADEIHCELTAPGFRYTPYATLSEQTLRRSVTCTSPSKAFNIAGLQMANIICADDSMRRRIDKAINANEVCDVNALAPAAFTAAYRHGEPWLAALNAFLRENDLCVRRAFAERLPAFHLPPLEATYLEWIDCSATGKDGDEIARILLDAGLKVNPGSMYGATTGKNFIRLNIACPRTLVNRALEIMCSSLGSL